MIIILQLENYIIHTYTIFYIHIKIIYSTKEKFNITFVCNGTNKQRTTLDILKRKRKPIIVCALKLLVIHFTLNVFYKYDTHVIVGENIT